MRREAEFLGFMVSGDGVRPLPSKIEAVLQIPVPETITHLRSFLGMCNFFHAHLPAFAEVSSPLTELLKGSKRGRQRLPWTLECDHAFAQLKDMLTSAPLLRHFDPSLRTAVHIDASQHAVGAVLLQWEENEQDPRPVCFLWRKLQGSQWHYDARNAEALAAQVALEAWRPLLYGVPFELVSDHAGLRHLFQQKPPSASILRLCEFLAEFDFHEVQYVRGAANLVPDFLSRPWDAEAPDVGLHALSHPRPPKSSALEVLAAQSPPAVVLLPVCQGRVAVFHDGTRFSLQVTVPMASEGPENVAHRMLRSMGVTAKVELHRVAAKGSLQFWRADILQPPALTVFALPELQWQHSAGMHRRDMWRRAHFDALRLFGVLPYYEVWRLRRCSPRRRRRRFHHLCQSSRLHSNRMPFCRVWVRRSTTVIMVCGEISVAMNRVYFAISARVTRRSVFVFHGYSAIPFCMWHMVTLLRATRASLVRRLILRNFSGGPTCSETLLISFEVAARAQLLKALLGCDWGLTRSLACPYSCSLIGVWTLLGRCLSPAVAMI
jgi:hypothetical protein